MYYGTLLHASAVALLAILKAFRIVSVWHCELGKEIAFAKKSLVGIPLLQENN